jgi:two-component SAPR family response regulator
VKIARLAEKALGLYRGHFLPADDSQYRRISYRERLRSRFSHLITRAGRRLEEAQEWEKAAEYYRQGIDIDDLLEEFYQRLMICCERLGRRADAIDVYKCCTRILSLKFGIGPSAKTEEIYRTMKEERWGIPRS